MLKQKKSLLVLALIFLTACNSKKLPTPTPMAGNRGEQFGVDKNINEDTLDKYLFRSDVVYRDLRMFIDPANYQAIGGDSYLSGYVNSFSIAPLPYIIPLELPPVVGESYQGETLFDYTNNTYTPRYKESMRIIEDLFPKNKAIFLMCGGAGYASAGKNFLISLGWDKNKIYNVGGYWYYEGKNRVNIKREENGTTYYDFWKVPYHDINFSRLTRN